MKLRQLISNAIRNADRSYFGEDYDDQAFQVLKALKESHYKIVPLTPNQAMIEEGKKAIPYGNSSHEELVTKIYEAMVKGSN